MQSLKNVSFKGKRVLIRVDFNVPLNPDFSISDDSRILAALPTIKLVMESGGKIILMSHLGRPKNGFETQFSLMHIVEHLSKVLCLDVTFVKDCIGSAVQNKISNLKDGSVLLLENLRFHPEEKSGDKAFSKQLANLADIYINDAFGTVHRAHASTSIIAQFFKNNKYFGLLLKKEIDNLILLSDAPKKPFTAIIGGAKISGKIDVICALLNKVNNLIIGGGMAYTFVKAMGGNIGNSLLEEDKIDLAKELIILAKQKNVNLYVPIDSINANNFDNNAETNQSKIKAIPDGFIGLDIGEKSIKCFVGVIENSKTIIWNGPMGCFEMSNFSNGTKKIAMAIISATENGAFSLIGGGDSLAAIKLFDFADRFSYISTGGGAMLEYLKEETLPGIKALLS
tara:strand:+ start:424 stop:1614 length:1191 start_codon:yes stop_codon:yes gene_type:complete